MSLEGRDKEWLAERIHHANPRFSMSALLRNSTEYLRAQAESLGITDDDPPPPEGIVERVISVAAEKVSDVKDRFTHREGSEEDMAESNTVEDYVARAVTAEAQLRVVSGERDRLQQQLDTANQRNRDLDDEILRLNGLLSNRTLTRPPRVEPEAIEVPVPPPGETRRVVAGDTDVTVKRKGRLGLTRRGR